MEPLVPKILVRCESVQDFTHLRLEKNMGNLEDLAEIKGRFL